MERYTTDTCPVVYWRALSELLIYTQALPKTSNRDCPPQDFREFRQKSVTDKTSPVLQWRMQEPGEGLVSSAWSFSEEVTHLQIGIRGSIKVRKAGKKEGRKERYA